MLWDFDFEIIKNNLQILMDHDQYLAPMNILRDLHILQRGEGSILTRFDRIESVTAVKKAMPWMLKCQEKTFKRFSSGSLLLLTCLEKLNGPNLIFKFSDQWSYMNSVVSSSTIWPRV